MSAYEYFREDYIAETQHFPYGKKDLSSHEDFSFNS